MKKNEHMQAYMIKPINSVITNHTKVKIHLPKYKACMRQLQKDEQYKMILFDHLIPFPSPFGNTMTAVPDGSYDGLKFEKGKWKFIDKVFNDSQKEAPFPEPVLDSRKGKDISGRAKRIKE